MNRYTCVSLILLRLVIGWHFLFEGLHKIHSLYSPKPFSSEIYFRESSGPLGKFMKGFLPDPDAELISKLDEKSITNEWNSTFKNFTSSYQLTPEQTKSAEEILEKDLKKTKEWLAEGKKEIEIPSPDGKPGGTLKINYTTPQWISYYKSKIDELEKIRTDDRSWYLGKELDKARIAATKAEIAKGRKELGDDYESQRNSFNSDLQKLLTSEQKSKTIKIDEKKPTFIHWINLMTIFGITAIGIGLFLGLFTRVACLGGIAFLAMTYLTIPPFPWLPVPPLNEGNYVFINKNMVEMFGMIVLFTTNSGRWFGLDAILANLLPSCCTWNSEPKS
ncbi:MAG: DoxX family protein [Gemmataceae bacterium]